MQVDVKDQEYIEKTIYGLLPTAKIIFFGSRMKGTAQKYSDLDVAVDDGQKIPLRILSQLRETFSESDLIYKIDLVDFQRLDGEF